VAVNKRKTSTKKRTTVRKKTNPQTTPPQDFRKLPSSNVELGITGLTHWSGRVDEEWLLELQGTHRIRTLKEMRDNDPIVGAILYAVDMLIRQVRWKVVPYSDKAKHRKDAQFLEECIDDMSQEWTKLLSEILSFLPYGYSFHEIVYKRRRGQKTSRPGMTSKYKDNKIGWRKIPIRSQDTLDRWEFDESGDPKAFVQRMWNTDISMRRGRGFEVTIPFQKGLLFRTTSHKGNPEGRSVLRNAYRPWYFKKRIEEIEGIGIERDLAGLPVMTVPSRIMSSQASPEEQAIYNSCKDIVTNIRRDEQEGIIIPGDSDTNGNKLYDLKLLSTGGQRQFDTNAIVGRYDQRIAMTVLADFVLLGHEKVGSFALSSSKTSLFATAIGAWLDEIKAVFNRHGIPRLFLLNGNRSGELPTLDYGDIETPDLTALGGYIREMAGAGAELFPDGDLENHLRDLANLPAKPDNIIDNETRTREASSESEAETAESGAVPEAMGGLPDSQTTPDSELPEQTTPPEGVDDEEQNAEEEEKQEQTKKAKRYHGVCKYCKRAAKFKIIHSEGRGIVKVCHDHVAKGKKDVKTNALGIEKIVKL